MKNLLALIGLVAIAVYVLKIDPSNILRMLQLPGFNLPGNQQPPQTPQAENQIPQTPQVDQTPQTPQPVQTPQATPKNQWGIGFKGAITTPFGATKNEASLGNPDFTDNENNESE